VRVTIHTKEGCEFCDKAKLLLKSRGVSYSEKTTRRVKDHSFPQIFIDGEFIGGYAELRRHKAFKPNMLTASETYKPFLYPELVDLAVQHEQMHWIEAEISLADDVSQWNNGTVSTEEKSFITNILRLFTQSDVAVAANYGDLFIPKFKNNEVRNWLYSVVARESVHQRAYALLNDTLGFPDAEYAKFLKIDEMANKAKFMLNNDNSTMRSLAMAMAKSMISEGVFLFASFAMLMNFPRKGKMMGMRDVVEWSVKDEDKHCDGLQIMFRHFCNEHPLIVDDAFKHEIYDMFREAVELEDKFITYVFEDYDIDGLSPESLKNYIRYIADRRLIQVGLKANWGVTENPLPWMEYMLSSSVHSNFFESRTTDYAKVGMTGNWDYSFLKTASF